MAKHLNGYILIKAGAPQGYPWTIFSFIYINDLSHNLLSPIKLSVDERSLFSVVNESNISANELNKDP